MYVVREEQVLNGIQTSIERTSKYPMPWIGKQEDGAEPIERPKYYYEEISTKITYTQDGSVITLIIPSVPPVYFLNGDYFIVNPEANRTRKIQVLVNGNYCAFEGAGRDILDMNQTFDVPEIDKLLSLSQINVPKLDTLFRACTPFFYMSSAKYRVPEQKRTGPNQDGWVSKTNGSLKNLVLPYIKAMQNSTPGTRKELYVPMNIKGSPHHWQLCVLIIDEHNKASITCIETDKYALSSARIFASNQKMYLHTIIPAINEALAECHFNSVTEAEVYFDGYKQFSKRGCGITVSLIVEKLLAGHWRIEGVPMTAGLEQHPVSVQHKVLSSKITERSYQRMSIEEDALRRVQLAFKLAAHNQYLQQSDSKVDAKNQYQFEAVLRELRTHPHTLSIKAKESFPVDNTRLDVPSECSATFVESGELEQEFQEALHKLQQTTLHLVDKGDKSHINYNPKYYKAGLAANRLHAELTNSATEFFRKPDCKSLQQFKDRCVLAINKAETEFKNHRHVWGTINPIIKGILGIVAALTLIPALVVSYKAPRGYCGTFFSKGQTSSSEQLAVFKQELLDKEGLLSRGIIQSKLQTH